MKKLIVFGVATGAAIAVVLLLASGAVIRFASRAPQWDSKSLIAVSGTANDIFTGGTSGSFTFVGFNLHVAIRNDSTRDIFISRDSKVMKRVTKGLVLQDLTDRVEFGKADFLPAGKVTELEMTIKHPCASFDAKGVALDRPHSECFNDVFGDADGLVVFDRSNRIELFVPKPDYR